MHEDITQEDIVRYAYKEVSEVEKNRIETALPSRPDLQQMLEDVHMLAAGLNSIHFNPHPTSVKIIIEESHDSSLEISNG
jgi:hypothetical protein